MSQTGNQVKGLFFERSTWGGGETWYVREWVGVARVIFAVVLFLTVVVGGITFLQRRTDVTRCRNTAERMHREFKSGWLEGCLVRLDDGSYIPLGNLRVQDIERSR